MPFLLAACDIYAAPSRLEGFRHAAGRGVSVRQAVLSLNAMGMRDTMVHNKTAYLAKVGQVIRINDTVVGEESGFAGGHRIVFDQPRDVEWRADPEDLAAGLLDMMGHAKKRQQMGRRAGARRAPLRLSGGGQAVRGLRHKAHGDLVA